MPASRAWSRRDHEFFLQLAGKGLTARAIAVQMTERLGVDVSRSAVISRMHRAGIWRKREKAEAPPKRPSPARVVAPEPAPQPVQPVVKRRCDDVATVALLDLQPHHCKWPVGHPGTPGFGFCGDMRVDGTPYCAGHNRRAVNGQV
jgi:GcrA cell cycle regulator